MRVIGFLGQAAILLLMIQGSAGGVFSTIAGNKTSEVTAQGTIQVFDGKVAPFTLQFDPEGGEVLGSIPVVDLSDGSFIDTGQFMYTGTFSGGDGGTIEGTCKCQRNCTDTAYSPEEWGGKFVCEMMIMTCDSCDCHWNGNLYAAGYGEGTSWCTNEGQVYETMTGAWEVTFPPGVFSGEAGEPPPQQVQPEMQLPEEPLPDELEPMGANSAKVEELQAAIVLEREENDPGYIGYPTARLLQWNGKLVSVNVDQNGQAYLEDVHGNQVAVDDLGNPLSKDTMEESGSSEVIEEHPDVDWNRQLDLFNRQIGSYFSTLRLPGMEFVEGFIEDPTPGPILTALQDIIGDPDLLGITELDKDESQEVQVEAFAMHSRGVISETVETTDELMEQVIQDCLKASNTRVEEEIQEALVSVLEEEPGQEARVPVEVTSEFYNRVAVIVGEDKIQELVEETGLDPDAAMALEEKLRELGVQEGELAKTINAVQAIRVLGNMAKEHTVSTSGLWGKLFSFIDNWMVYRAATDAVINDPDLNMSQKQMDLIQKSVSDLNVFEEGVENFAVTQFKDHVLEMIEDLAEED